MPKSQSLKTRNNSGILPKRHTRHVIFKILTKKNKTKNKKTRKNNVEKSHKAHAMYRL